jgi:hypothetical protein
MFASAELRAAKGLDSKAKESLYAKKMLVTVDEIAAAFWQTPWGHVMRDELDHKPFRRCRTGELRDTSQEPFDTSKNWANFLPWH